MSQQPTAVDAPLDDAPADDLAADLAALDVSTALETPRLRLIPPDPSHYPGLREAELSGSLAMRWRFRGATPSPEEYVQMLWRGVLAQFLVTPVSTGAPVGLVAAYDADTRGRYAYLAAAKFDPEDRSPLFFEGVALFVNHVFHAWPFHKLYLDLPEYNAGVIQSGIGDLLQEEGRLRGHTYAAGRYWDQITLALYRDTWMEHADLVMRMVRRGG